MVVAKYTGLFIEHAREIPLVRAENCVECFLKEFLDPAYSVRKIANLRMCRAFDWNNWLLVRWWGDAQGGPNFGLK